MKKTFALWLLVLAVVPWTRAFTLAPDGDQLYKVTDLGTLPGGFFSEGFGISSAGQVVGAADCATCGGFIHGFLWTQSGGMPDFRTLPDGTLSAGMGTNARAQALGGSTWSSGGGSPLCCPRT